MKKINFVLALLTLVVVLVSCGRTDKSDYTSSDKSKTESLTATTPTTQDNSSSNTTNTTTTKTTTPTPSMNVSADALYTDYHANEVRADSKYKGKTIKVSGTVSEIRKTFLDEIVVELSAGSSWSTVDCRIVDSQTNKASNLNKGQSVTIVGECTGMVIGSVQMENCTIK